MPNDPQNSADLANAVRRKLAEVNARIQTVADEADPLRRRRDLSAAEQARLDALNAEEILLLGVSTNLGVLLARLNDENPNVDKILKIATLVRGQVKKAAETIGILPTNIAGGANLVGQAAGAIPKALEGLETVLNLIEEKNRT